MFFECISCPKLGVSCDGPNFVAMPVPALMEWCKQRKAKLGWTNAKLAEESKTPKGTIDRLLSGDTVDCKVETIRPIIQALIGGTFNGNPCPDSQPVAATPDTALLLQIHDLEKDLSYAEKTISRLEDSIKSWKQAIYAIMLLCGVLAVSLVGYIIMDMTHTDIGLIRETHTNPVVLLPILGIVAVCVAAVMLIRHKIENHK